MRARVPARHGAFSVGSATFDPSGIPGLVGWYDFADVSTLFTDTVRLTAVTADGNAIGSVADKSGAGNHLTRGGGAGTEGTYKTGIVNGRSVARFDGVSKFLSGTGASLIAAFNGTDLPYSVFIVVRLTSTAVGQTWATFGVGRIASATPFYRMRWTGPYNVAHRDDAAAFKNVDVASDPALFAPAVVQLSHVTPGTTISTWTNGVPLHVNADLDVGATTVDVVSLAGVNLGGTPSSFLAGDIGEAVFYNRALSIAQHNTLGAYIANRWGLIWTTVT